jgi:hypothetical protein
LVCRSDGTWEILTETIDPIDRGMAILAEPEQRDVIDKVLADNPEFASYSTPKAPDYQAIGHIRILKRRVICWPEAS